MKKNWTFTIHNPLYWLYNNSFISKKFCKHKEWDMDTQIRTIKCRNCGKKAWVKEYKDLYQNELFKY